MGLCFGIGGLRFFFGLVFSFENIKFVFLGGRLVFYGSWFFVSVRYLQNFGVVEILCSFYQWRDFLESIFIGYFLFVQGDYFFLRMYISFCKFLVFESYNYKSFFFYYVEFFFCDVIWCSGRLQILEMVVFFFRWLCLFFLILMSFSFFLGLLKWIYYKKYDLFGI